MRKKAAAVMPNFAPAFKLWRPFPTKEILNSWKSVPPRREVSFCTSVPARPRSSFASLARPPPGDGGRARPFHEHANLNLYSCRPESDRHDFVVQIEFRFGEVRVRLNFTNVSAPVQKNMPPKIKMRLSAHWPAAGLFNLIFASTALQGAPPPWPAST